MADYREAFVGIDVAKLRNAVAIADAGREGEVRFFGEVDASATNMRRVLGRIGTTTGPDRDAVNFDLDDPGIRLGLAAHRFALTANSGRRHYGIHHRRHKLYFFHFGMTARSFSQLTAPAKQLLRRQSMPSRYRTDRVAARNDLRNNPRLVLVAPLPPTAGSSEDLKPPHRLRDSTMHCVHSKPNGSNKPQTRRSPRQPVGGR
ncbi:hypothetical protein ACVIGA_008871 [Bradyrhizobium sp. USDA 3240]